MSLLFNLNVILLTAKGEVENRIKGLELGADDYVGKPFEPKELLLRIENIIKNTDGVISYKLCGAGNGGHMLVITKNEIKFGVFNIKINIDNRGMKSWTLQ